MKDVKDIFLKYVIKHKSTLVACTNRIHTRLDSDYFQIKQSKKCNSTTIGHFYFTISRCARYTFFSQKTRALLPARWVMQTRRVRGVDG